MLRDIKARQEQVREDHIYSFGDDSEYKKPLGAQT